MVLKMAKVMVRNLVYLMVREMAYQMDHLMVTETVDLKWMDYLKALSKTLEKTMDV